MKKVTAVEFLKTFAVTTPSMIPNMSNVLRRIFDDKGFSLSVVNRMAKAKVFDFIPHTLHRVALLPNRTGSGRAHRRRPLGRLALMVFRLPASFTSTA